MKVKNLKGDGEFEINLSNTEVEFLVNLALDYLVEKQFVEYQVERDNSVTMKILKELNIEQFHRC